MIRVLISFLLSTLGLSGCSTAAQLPSTEFARSVGFDVVAMKADAADSVRVDAVWGNYNTLKPGQPCWIHGSYSLSSPRGSIELVSLAGSGVFGSLVLDSAVASTQGLRSVGRGTGTFDFIVEVNETGLYRLVLAGTPTDVFGDFPDRLHVLVRLQVEYVQPMPFDGLRPVGAP